MWAATEDDETFVLFQKAFEVYITQVCPKRLILFPKESIRVKDKYYMIYQYIKNDFISTNNTIECFIDKY